MEKLTLKYTTHEFIDGKNAQSMLGKQILIQEFYEHINSIIYFYFGKPFTTFQEDNQSSNNLTREFNFENPDTTLCITQKTRIKKPNNIISFLNELLYDTYNDEVKKYQNTIEIIAPINSFYSKGKDGLLSELCSAIKLQHKKDDDAKINLTLYTPIMLRTNLCDKLN